MTEEQIDQACESYAGSDLINQIAVPSEIRFKLSPVKEHLIVYMWEHFIKLEIYRLELQGLSADDLLEVYSFDELLEAFAHYQIGYWEGVNEAKEEDDEQ
jgi:hypothetical protein